VLVHVSIDWAREPTSQHYFVRKILKTPTGDGYAFEGFRVGDFYGKSSKIKILKAYSQRCRRCSLLVRIDCLLTRSLNTEISSVPIFCLNKKNLFFLISLKNGQVLFSFPFSYWKSKYVENNKDWYWNHLG